MMHAASSGSPGVAPRVLTAPLPLIAVAGMASLPIGLALPLLPLCVHQGLDPFVAGLGNPKMRPPTSGDRVTFGRGLTHLGRPSPGKSWVLSGISLRLPIGGVGRTARRQLGLALEA